MRVAYLECFSGISGDMMLGALLHTGVSRELLQQTAAALNIGAEIPNSPNDCTMLLTNMLINRGRRYNPFAAKYRSASSAAMQPVPAEVTAWR